MGIKRTAEERAQLIDKYKASGLSISKFAAQENIPLSTFHAWLSLQTKPQEFVKFLRVARKTLPKPVATHASQPTARVLVEFRGWRIHVNAGCETSTLAVVLECLERFQQQEHR